MVAPKEKCFIGSVLKRLNVIKEAKVVQVKISNSANLSRPYAVLFAYIEGRPLVGRLKGEMKILGTEVGSQRKGKMDLQSGRTHNNDNDYYNYSLDAVLFLSLIHI